MLTKHKKIVFFEKSRQVYYNLRVTTKKVVLTKNWQINVPLAYHMISFAQGLLSDTTRA